MRNTNSTEHGEDASRGSGRGAAFGAGAAVGLVLGVAATLLLPGLLPASEPDCVRPERVVWSQEDGGGVQLDITYAGDGTDGCDAGVVFSERPSAGTR